MPDLVMASSNTARMTGDWIKNARPYVGLAAVVLAAASPALGTMLLAAILGLTSTLISAVLAIQGLAMAGQNIAHAMRTTRAMPTMLVAILLVVLTVFVTWLVIRWSDKRRAARTG